MMKCLPYNKRKRLNIMNITYLQLDRSQFGSYTFSAFLCEQSTVSVTLLDRSASGSVQRNQSIRNREFSFSLRNLISQYQNFGSKELKGEYSVPSINSVKIHRMKYTMDCYNKKSMNILCHGALCTECIVLHDCLYSSFGV